jgi:hypothetical protein
MRFMMIMFPSGYGNGKPGTVPDLKAMEVMGKYNEQLQKAGVLLALDGLTPHATMNARFSFKGGKSKVTDGPFPETKEVIGGYWIIQVKSREEALEWASRIPGSDIEMVEVHRLFHITDFDTEIQKEIQKKFGDAAWAGPGPIVKKLSALFRFRDASYDVYVAAGVRVFVGALTSASDARSLRAQPDGRVLITDGPYLETKEHIGGFWVLEVADLEEALAWGRRAVVDCRAPVEVRPFGVLPVVTDRPIS